MCKGKENILCSVKELRERIWNKCGGDKRSWDFEIYKEKIYEFEKYRKKVDIRNLCFLIGYCCFLWCRIYYVFWYRKKVLGIVFIKKNYYKDMNELWRGNINFYYILWNF